MKRTESFRKCLDVVAKERKYLLLQEAPPLKAVKHFVKSNIDHRVPQVFAVLAGRVVGWADIKPLDHPLQKHRAVLGMGVHPDFRGRGIGGALLKACLEQARRVGIEKVELSVLRSNQRAVRLYRKLGFRDEGKIARYTKIDGGYDVALLMALLL